jgi:hypothetical protein
VPYFAVLFSTPIFDSAHFKSKSVRWSNSFGKRCTGDQIKDDAMLVTRSKKDKKYIQNL